MENVTERTKKNEKDINFDNFNILPPNLNNNGGGGGGGGDNYSSVFWIAMIFIVIGIAFLFMNKNK